MRASPRIVAMQRLRIMTSVLLLGLAACGASDSSSTPGSDIPRGGNVLLISLDTLRADALSSYGNPHLTSPVLDKLAASGLRFEEVLAQAPNTATSHASLFTGVYPWTHRVSNVSRGDEKFYSLPDDFVTLAEAFDQQGYATAAFTDGGPFSPKWDLLQGFRHTRNQLEGAKAKVQEVLGHLDANADDERPWFVFMHTYEVHQPYMPPVEWAERFHDGSYDGPLIQREKEVRSELERAGRKTLKGRVLVDGFEDFSEQDIRYLWEMYLGAVAYTDYQMGLLFDGLRERGLYDDTLIVITSDHGEEFGEHGRFGHSQVYHETLSVPLLVHLPEGSPAAWAGTVIPERWGQERGLDVASSQATLAPLFKEVRGTLDWYCLDFWSQKLALDIPTIKTAYSEGIRWRPQAETFLRHLCTSHLDVVLITNAHPVTLAMKAERLPLAQWFNHMVSSHDYGAPKETTRFWDTLMANTTH